MSFGPNPWQQAHWDWRAAGNFICGGAGAGLLIATVVSGVAYPLSALLVLAGMGLVGLGLLCVWLEIGRPWRAMNVFFNLRGSWMSREAVVSVLLFGFGLGLVVGVKAWAMPLAIAALVFVYCQARIVQAAKGIPAWREPLTVPLLVVTGLAEGMGLFLLGTAWLRPAGVALIGLFVLLVLARWVLWRLWRERVAHHTVASALAAIDSAGFYLQWWGGALPLALAGLAATGAVPQILGAVLLAVAGLAASATGSAFKFSLITRAAFNQGFALARLPVRGVAR